VEGTRNTCERVRLPRLEVLMGADGESDTDEVNLDDVREKG
jgi:hypothetical protein